MRSSELRDADGVEIVCLLVYGRQHIWAHVVCGIMEIIIRVDNYDINCRLQDTLNSWFGPLRESLDAFINETQKVVTGTVRLLSLIHI
jgi:hypothetical protein